jgi:hypothetical protein
VLLFVVRFCLRSVAGTEQQLTPADDILLGDQVIELDQLCLPALKSAILWIPGVRLVFVVLRCAHFDLLLTSSVPARKTRGSRNKCMVIS